MALNLLAMSADILGYCARVRSATILRWSETKDIEMSYHTQDKLLQPQQRPRQATHQSVVSAEEKLAYACPAPSHHHLILESCEHKQFVPGFRQ